MFGLSATWIAGIIVGILAAGFAMAMDAPLVAGAWIFVFFGGLGAFAAWLVQGTWWMIVLGVLVAIGAFLLYIALIGDCIHGWVEDALPGDGDAAAAESSGMGRSQRRRRRKKQRPHDTSKGGS